MTEVKFSRKKRCSFKVENETIQNQLDRRNKIITFSHCGELLSLCKLSLTLVNAIQIKSSGKIWISVSDWKSLQGLLSSVSQHRERDKSAKDLPWSHSHTEHWQSRHNQMQWWTMKPTRECEPSVWKTVGWFNSAITTQLRYLIGSVLSALV